MALIMACCSFDQFLRLSPVNFVFQRVQIPAALSSAVAAGPGLDD